MAMCDTCFKPTKQATKVKGEWRYWCPTCRRALVPAPQRAPVEPKPQWWER